MGRIDLQNIGIYSGKMGPVVAYVTKSGKQVYRSYVVPANPHTPRQEASRAQFALVSRGLAPLRKVVARGYPRYERAYFELFSQARREAVEGEYPHYTLNYAKLQLAAGPLPLPPHAGVQYDAASEMLRFSWDPSVAPESTKGSDNDQITLVTLHAGDNVEVQTHIGSFRATGQLSFPLPGGWEPAATHCWLYLTSHNMEENSDSLYLGRAAP